MSWKGEREPKVNIAWEDRLTWFKRSPEYRALDRIDGEPMEFEWNIFPGFTTLELCTQVQESLSRLSVTPEKFKGRIIFMNISWGFKDNQKMRVKCSTRFSLCKEIWSRTMVILRTWIRKEVVLYQWRQSTGRMGQNCRANDVDIGRKHTPSIPIHESIVQRRAQEQRLGKIVNTLLRRPGKDWNCFSHNYFCQSAQYLLNSRRNLWRMWLLPWKNRETCCGRTI